MPLELVFPKTTVGAGAGASFPAAGQFFHTSEVEDLTVTLAVGSTTARGISIELAHEDGTVFATLTPATIPAATSGAYTIGMGNVSVGTNFIAIPIVIPAKVRINLLAAGANSVDVAIYGR